MNDDRSTLIRIMTQSEADWNNHDLEKVMGLFHDDVVFEYWHGATVSEKKAL